MMSQFGCLLELFTADSLKMALPDVEVLVVVVKGGARPQIVIS